MTPLLGIDISHHQGLKGMPLAKFRALKQAGVEFCIIRASIGTKVDGAFEANRKRAEDMGFVVGAYHFLLSQKVVEPEAQMETFDAVVRRTGGWKGLLSVIDVEWYDEVPRLHWADARRAAKRLNNLMPDKHPLVVYTSEGYWRAMGNPDATTVFDYLWQARWPGNRVDEVSDLPDSPPRAGFGGFRRTPLWQFGALKYKVGTEWKSLDGNAFYGTREELLRWGGAIVRPPIEERAKYRAGYNDALAPIITYAEGLVLPDGSPVYVAGATEGKADAVAKLRGLIMQDPDA